MSDWISVREKLPETHKEKLAKTIQHPEDREIEVSDYVLAWDSFYGPRIDRIWNGVWQSEIKSRGQISADVIHSIVCWKKITPPPQEMML